MKVNFLEALKIGGLELERFQELNHKISDKILRSVYQSEGIILESKDRAQFLETYGDDWKVSQVIGDASMLKINVGNALLLDANGNYNLIVKDPAEFQYYETTGTSYSSFYIYLKYKPINYETGKVSGSLGGTVITGVGTEFTKIFAQNREIIIGNDAYVVLSVTTDTSLILRDTLVSLVSGSQFSVGGWFAETVSEKKIYTNDSFEFISSDAEVVNDQYVLLAKIERDVEGDAVTAVRDYRHKSIAKQKETRPIRNFTQIISPIDQDSTIFYVDDWGTLDFPESFTADFSTYFIRTPEGAFGFKWTSKTNNTFEGVTIDRVGDYTVSTYAKIFSISSCAIMEGKLFIGDRVLYYSKGTANSSFIVNDNFTTAGQSLALQNYDGSLTGDDIKNGIGLFRGSNFKIKADGRATFGGGTGAQNLEIDLSHSTGKIKLQKDGVDILQISDNEIIASVMQKIGNTFFFKETPTILRGASESPSGGNIGDMVIAVRLIPYGGGNYQTYTELWYKGWYGEIISVSLDDTIIDTELHDPELVGVWVNIFTNYTP